MTTLAQKIKAAFNSTIYMAILLALSSKLLAIDEIPKPLSVQDLNIKIIEQQEQISTLVIQAAQTKRNHIKTNKNLIDKRVEIKQLELAIKRSQSLINSDSDAQRHLRTYTYKKRVAEIELAKLKKLEHEVANLMTQHTEQKSALDAALVELNHQLDLAKAYESEKKQHNGGTGGSRRREPTLDTEARTPRGKPRWGTNKN